MLGGLAVAIVFWVRPEVALEPPQYGLAKAWGFKAIVATVGVWGPYLISWRFANDDVLGHRKFYLWVVLFALCTLAACYGWTHLHTLGDWVSYTAIAGGQSLAFIAIADLCAKK